MDKIRNAKVWWNELKDEFNGQFGLSANNIIPMHLVVLGEQKITDHWGATMFNPPVPVPYIQGTQIVILVSADAPAPADCKASICTVLTTTLGTFPLKCLWLSVILHNLCKLHDVI